MAIRKFLAFVTFLFPVIGLAQAENPALRKEIEAVYRKFDSMVAKNDTKGIADLLHESFIQVDADGNTMTKEQLKKAHGEVLKSVQSPRSKCVVESIFDHGSEVVAWITMTMDFKFKDGDKLIPMKLTMKFAETLIRTPQGWKFTYSQMLPD